MKLLRWLAGLATVLLAAAGAYQAGTQATKRRQQAAQERALVDGVTAHGHVAIEATARAKEHDRVAEEASRRASERVQRIRDTEPELSEVISALTDRPKRRRRKKRPA